MFPIYLLKKIHILLDSCCSRVNCIFAEMQPREPTRQVSGQRPFCLRRQCRLSGQEKMAPGQEMDTTVVVKQRELPICSPDKVNE